MKWNKSNVIKKPSFKKEFTVFFFFLTLILIFITFFEPLGMIDTLGYLKTDEARAITTLESVVSEYYISDRTPEDQKAFSEEIIASCYSGLSSRIEIDGEVLVDTYKKASVVSLFDYQGDRRIFKSLLNWDKDHLEDYKELSDYLNNSDYFNAYLAKVNDIYYDAATNVIYPGKVELLRDSIFSEIFSNFSSDDTELKTVKEYDLTPSDTTGLEHITDISFSYMFVSKEAPINEPGMSAIYAPIEPDNWESEINWIKATVNYDCPQTDRMTREIWIFYIVISFVIIAIIAAICATINYLRKKNIYSIFEYRQKTTNAMAHDLKTPLAIASVYVSNLKETLDNPELSKNNADEIEDSINHMNKLVNDILEFSNSETDSNKLSKDEVNIKSEIDAHIKSIDMNLKSRGLSVKVTGEAVKTLDRKLWNQAINNLIDNAVIYCSDKSTIDINIAGNGLTVSNKVDNDIGDAERLKEPFVKGDSARGENSGSGLGLAIANNNLNRLGYKLSISCENKTFVAKVSK